MPGDFVISARAIRNQAFTDDVGSASYLVVPDGQLPAPAQKIKAKDWFAAVLAAATTAPDGSPIVDPHTGKIGGSVVVFVHGYAVDLETAMRRHRVLKAGLAVAGYKGTVVSFDWPSGDQVAAYLPDRAKAVDTAHVMVDDCLADFVDFQQPDCPVQLHVLGHSTGAFVIVEAFRTAHYKLPVDGHAWTANQIVFIAGDVAQDMMAADNREIAYLLSHSKRITNYSNGNDWVLQISSAKRAFIAPRIGRVGLPVDAPSTSVNVDCSDYFAALPEPANPVFTPWAHSWHMQDPGWYKDFFLTIDGGLDRAVLPTRELRNGRLVLRRG